MHPVYYCMHMRQKIAPNFILSTVTMLTFAMTMFAGDILEYTLATFSKKC